MAHAVRIFLQTSFGRAPLLRNVICASRTEVRGHSRSARPLFKSLWLRRIEEGPPKERHRSEWLNWNRGAEVFAFGKRLGEDFSEESLNVAFTDKSYVEQDMKQRAQLGVGEDEAPVQLTSNSELSAAGHRLASEYVQSYLRHVYPALPEEGISAIKDYLMSDEQLAYVGKHLGIKDLVLCDELHPSEEKLSRAFSAVIGALSNDQGVEAAQQFVQDFILTMLIGKNINEMWNVVNPMGLLEGVLVKQGRGAPEPRLLWSTGSSTVTAVYVVGIYSDKQYVAKGYGETTSIAEEMAARAALRKYFGTDIHMPPLPFGKEGRQLQIDHSKNNTSALDYTKQAQLQ